MSAEAESLFGNFITASVVCRETSGRVFAKKLDEEVAAHMVSGFGGVVTQLTAEQAQYINVGVEGPFKPDTYRY